MRSLSVVDTTVEIARLAAEMHAAWRVVELALEGSAESEIEACDAYHDARMAWNKARARAEEV